MVGKKEKESRAYESFRRAFKVSWKPHVTKSFAHFEPFNLIKKDEILLAVLAILDLGT